MKTVATFSFTVFHSMGFLENLKILKTQNSQNSKLSEFGNLKNRKSRNSQRSEIVQLKDNPIGETLQIRRSEPPSGYETALAYYAHIVAQRRQIVAEGQPADGIVAQQLSDNRVLFTWFENSLPSGFTLADVRVPGAF